MTEFGICETPDILRVIYFIKIIIDIVKIVVPIMLILYVMFDCAKNVMNSDKKISESLKKHKNRIISAILVFTIPTFINIVLEIIDENTGYESCFANANSETIEKYQLAWDAYEEEKKREEEEKRQQELENNQDNEEIIYDESTDTHINSINKIKYNLYNQSDSRWGSVVYTNLEKKPTISSIGCIITSVAVVSSASNSDITPHTVFKSHRHQWSYISVNELSNGEFTCIKNNGMDKSTIIENLKKGNVAIIMVKSGSNFTGSQHYMALLDIKQDGSEIFVGNSYGSGTGNYNRSGWFKSNAVLYDIHEVNMCTPSDSLIDKHSDNKISTTNDNSSSSNNSTSGTNSGSSNNGSSGSNNNGSSSDSNSNGNDDSSSNSKICYYCTGSSSSGNSYSYEPSKYKCNGGSWVKASIQTGCDTSSGSSNTSTDSSSSNSDDESGIGYVYTSELGCTVYYNVGQVKEKLGFKKSELNNIKTILTNVCKYINNTGFTSYLQTGGSLGGGGFHALGLAVDLNNQWSFNQNGKTYYPYSSQGTGTWGRYSQFICEVCNGKEDCKYNINYNIYMKYFRPYGWCWGGFWNANYFDPMHFEKRTGGCDPSYIPKRTFDC